MQPQIKGLQNMSLQIIKFFELYEMKRAKFKDCMPIIHELVLMINEQMEFEQLKFVVEFVKESKRISALVNYIKDLDEKGVNLEDLTDIIDDTSQETDAYI